MEIADIRHTYGVDKKYVSSAICVGEVVEGGRGRLVERWQQRWYDGMVRKQEMFM